MGGTDRQDQNRNKYRKAFRGKKCYWCIVTWIIDVAVQNVWTLQKKSAGKLIHRAFKVEIAQTYLARYGVPPKRTMSLSLSHRGGRKRVADELQYDGVDHYLIETPAKFRRRCVGFNCTKRVSSECCKCDRC